MESTAPTVPPTNLLAAFATVPDPRREASVIYPLPAILALAVAAILCAHTSVLAIAEWGARQSADLLEPLGFAAGETPCQSTLHRLFRKLDARAVAAALRQGFDDPADRERGEEGVALDGKAQRGRRQFREGAGVVAVLTAFCQERSVVLAEEPIEQGQDKAEAELTVAPRVVEQLDWQGRVLTGDALYCQRELCQQVLDRGGDYLLTVKANQPTLHRLLVRTFDPQARPLLHCQEAGVPSGPSTRDMGGSTCGSCGPRPIRWPCPIGPGWPRSSASSGPGGRRRSGTSRCATASPACHQRSEPPGGSWPSSASIG